MKKQNKSVMLTLRITQDFYDSLYERYLSISSNDYWFEIFPTFSDYLRFLLRQYISKDQ